MLNSAQNHNEDDQFETSFPQQKGMGGEGKTRSKHSETEQRRRSKINERFERLRGLLPQNDQKKDKASFLSEVIDYIQYLHAQIDIYERLYEGWSQEPAKLTPWRKHAGAAEDLTDNSNVIRNGSGADSIAIPPAIFMNPQNLIESDLERATVDRGIDHPTQELYSMQIQPMFDSIASDVATPHLQDPVWQSLPCSTKRTIANNIRNGSELQVESGSNSISNYYSQEVLNTLTQVLQSSGVDLSQASVSVEFDVSNIASSSQDNQNPALSNQMMEHSGVDICRGSDPAHKRPRTENR